MMTMFISKLRLYEISMTGGVKTRKKVLDIFTTNIGVILKKLINTKAKYICTDIS